ncbi:MAG: type IV pilus twitching motility protein PilT [Vicinamibacteria bacterium]
MSRLTPLLDALRKAEAEEMRLEPGERISVIKTGGRRISAGREPMQAATLLHLAADALSPVELSRLGATPHRIDRRQGAERYQIEFTRPNGTVSITIKRMTASAPAAGVARRASSREPAAPSPAAAAPPDFAGDDMNSFLLSMVEAQASDLHLSSGSCPVLRVHGEIQFLRDSRVLTSDEIRRLAYSILDEETRKTFEEKRDVDCAYEIPGLSRFRVNVFEDRKGVGTVIRTIPVSLQTAEELGLPPAVLELCFLTKGLVLVTGPTGSGKSTTLAAMVDYINKRRSDHIITIEDPIEFVHENQMCLVNQRQVGRNTRSFKAALRAALREDPDIVLVGELRDLETIAIAIETAETGHLVFGTLHTTSAVATIDRMIDQFPPDQQAQVRVMLADALKGVISQVLCKKKGGGRVAALEVLLGTPALASLIREGKTFQIPSIMQTSKRQGMVTMNDSLFALVKQGLVEPKEAWMKAAEKTALLGLLKTNGIDVDFATAT